MGRRHIVMLVSLSWATAVTLAAHAEPATLDVPADSSVLNQRVVDLDQHIARNPKDARAYVRRGENFFRLREFDKAIEDFNTALHLDSDLADAYFGRGMARGRAGEIAAGIEDLGEYIRRHPNSSLAYTKRGVRHIWNNDLEKAEQDLTRAIALDPRNAEAHDDLGVILAQRGDYPAAIKHFETTIRIDPSYQKAHHNLAMVFYITDQNQKALTAVNASLQLLAESRDSMLLKAAILESLGRKAEAKIAREEAEFLPQGSSTERSALQ